MKCARATLALAVGLIGPAATAADSPHVILITIDGLAAYNLDDPDLVIPNIRELARGGVQAESSETIFPA
jgi:predicted AlkP superfamily pyrophosphatase or phosphodiesterase